MLLASSAAKCSVPGRRNCYLSPAVGLSVTFSSTFSATMKTFSVATRALVAAALFLSSGCASIVSGRHAEVTIHSIPSNAHVVVRNKRGQEVASLNTPAKVALKRKDKFIFPARYTATIAAPGYQPVDVPIRSTVNPWILGNVVIGGIPGLVVDNATGAAWMPRQSEIHQQLSPIYTAQQAPHVPQSAAAAGYREAQLPSGRAEPMLQPGATY